MTPSPRSSHCSISPGGFTVIEDADRNPDRKNAASRQMYSERRAKGLCTACGAPSQGASRCAHCSEKSYHGSAYFRGIPVWYPTWTAIELDAGREHGPFDSSEEVARCLAFEKLDRGQVELVSNAPVTTSLAGWV